MAHKMIFIFRKSNSVKIYCIMGLGRHRKKCKDCLTQSLFLEMTKFSAWDYPADQKTLQDPMLGPAYFSFITGLKTRNDNF